MTKTTITLEPGEYVGPLVIIPHPEGKPWHIAKYTIIKDGEVVRYIMTDRRFKLNANGNSVELTK